MPAVILTLGTIKRAGGPVSRWTHCTRPEGVSSTQDRATWPLFATSCGAEEILGSDTLTLGCQPSELYRANSTTGSRDPLIWSIAETAAKAKPLPATSCAGYRPQHDVLRTTLGDHIAS